MKIKKQQRKENKKQNITYILYLNIWIVSIILLKINNSTKKQQQQKVEKHWKLNSSSLLLLQISIYIQTNCPKLLFFL